VALTRFFQSLDNDGNIEKYIKITSRAASTFSFEQNLSQLDESEVKTLVEDADKTYVAQQPAMEHLKENIEKLVSISIVPQGTTIALGERVKFTAEGIFSTGIHKDLTNKVKWVSSSPEVALMNGSQARARKMGTTVIEASYKDINTSVNLIVTQAYLVSLDINATDTEIVEGTETKLVAIGTLSDQIQSQMTNQVIWSSTDTDKATIDNEGNIKALKVGEVTFKAKKDGVIKKVAKNFVVVKYKDGEEEVFFLDPKSSGSEVKVAIEYDILVKEGEKVKKNQLIAKHKYFFDDQGVYKAGMRLYTVFLPYDGYNFQDAIIISETTAKKLGLSVHIEQKLIRIHQYDQIVSMVKDLGQVKAGSNLIVIKPKFHLLDQNDEYDVNPDVVSLAGYKIYNLKHDSDILDIELYAPSREFVEKHFPNLLPLFEKQIQEAKQKLSEYEALGIEPDKLTKLKANPFGVLIGGKRLKNELVVRYTYRYERELTVGDKLANLHGNKGVVARIIPDELMPRDPDGKPFDIIVNQLGVVSRKNIGQLLELYFSRACYYMTEKLKETLKHGSYETALQELKQFYEIVYERKPSIKQQLINQLERLSSQDKKSLIDDFINHGVVLYSSPVDGLNLEDVYRVFNFYGWKLEDYVTLPEFNNAKTKYPVAYGYLYWLKLKQLVETKLSARSFGKHYQGKTLQPIGAKGERAQREGELDTWSLLSWGANTILSEFMTVHADDLKAKYAITNAIMNKGEASLENVKLDKPVSNKMLKAYLGGMMIIKDLDI
jgi:DNA-directed RNA polymerase beta subunit